MVEVKYAAYQSGGDNELTGHSVLIMSCQRMINFQF